MKARIIYDSFFGNTEQVAQAIGRALGSSEEVDVLRVADIGPEPWTGVPLLVVGSPTRAFSPSPAIKALLKSIPRNALQGVRVATFDTRIALDDVDSRILPPLVKVFGYAAKPIADRLVKKGGTLVIPPEGFFVKESEGPLKDGELERAADWARQLAVVS